MNYKGKSSLSIIVLVVALIVVLATIFLIFNKMKTTEKNDVVDVVNVVDDIPSEPIAENKVELKDRDIIYDTKFGGAYINISIDDFNAIGFQYGDSVRIEFSNGYKLEDVPYYNGYYVPYGDVVLVAYPGYEYIKLGINFGDDLWEIAGLSENDTCTVTLNENAKYIDIQKVRDIHYSDEQGEMLDEVFANFRPMNVGNLKENIIYRGASPIDNTHNRAPVADRLIEKAGISYIINLADTSGEIEKFASKEDFNSPYYMKQYREDKDVLLFMDANFRSAAFKEKLVRGLTEVSKNNGPYYIHCQEGKDRTGYVCFLIEALMGATYEEIVDDYMKTYNNYYGITLETDPERYNLIKEQNIDEMIKYVARIDNIEKVHDITLKNHVTNYLVGIGMNREDLDNLKAKLEK